MLKIQNLTHVYSGGVKALDDVSLEIGPGMFGLLGPNGAGKSTLMRCVATLQTPTSGRILFGETDVINEPEKLRRKLGYLPQDFGVHPRVSAYHMLDHLAALKGLADSRARRETVEALLVKTNLWAVRRQALAGFSGGMRQRFGVAQALIGLPALVIVDEPTAGLDPEERNRFFDLLSEVGETVIVILSTHIVQDVAEICTRMAIIAGGRIVELGNPSDLTTKLRGRVWRKLAPKGEVDRIREAQTIILTRLVAGQTMIHVLADDRPGEGFEPVEPGVEDVYFSTIVNHREAA